MRDSKEKAGKRNGNLGNKQWRAGSVVQEHPCYQNTLLFHCWALILERSGTRTLWNSNALKLERSSIRTLWYSNNTLLFERSDIRTFRCSNVQTFDCSGIATPYYSNIPSPALSVIRIAHYSNALLFERSVYWLLLAWSQGREKEQTAGHGVQMPRHTGSNNKRESWRYLSAWLTKEILFN